MSAVERLKTAIERERQAANVYLMLRTPADLRAYASARTAVDAVIEEVTK